MTKMTTKQKVLARVAELDGVADAKFGTVYHNGKTLTLTQQAYLDSDGSNDCEGYYSAAAVDADGIDYKVRWEILSGFDGEDEGDACDWENPSLIVER